MNTILKKHYITIGVSTVLCLIVLGTLGVVFSQMKTRTSETNSLKEKLVSYQVNRKAFNDESAQVASLQSRLVLLEKNIIHSSSVPELLSRLEALAATNRTEFEITSVQNIVEGEVPKLLIEYTSRGSYEQVASLFENLQHQEFQVRFRKLYVFSEQGSKSSPEVSGTLPGQKPKTAPASKEIKWQGVATIEITSFQ